MDADRFDSLTRSLHDGRSRRVAFGGLLAGTLGLLAWSNTQDAAAKNCKKIKDKQRRKKCLKKAKDILTPVPVSPPTPCANGIKDGSETDIDCGGGTCRRCGITQICLTRNDCASAFCAGTPTTCQPCVNAITDCGNDADGVTACACRDHESGQRFCTKNGTGDVRVLPAGTPCTACQGSEQCFPINGGANGIECIRPCGAV